MEFCLAGSAPQADTEQAALRDGMLGEERPLALGFAETGVGPAGAWRRRAIGSAGPILLVAVAAGLFGQGAYYPPVQRHVSLLVAAAAILALVACPPTRGDLRLPPVLPAAALVGWAVLDAALLGHPASGPAGLALLLLGALAVLLACRRLGREDREVLLAGVIGIGVAVALAGWLGVVGRLGALAWEGQGVWRASSTLSYPNATAAVLAPLALLALARLARPAAPATLALAATVLLVGLGATMSRAGLLGFAVGLVVLTGLLGLRATARAAVGPSVGALVALACLVPSLPVAGPPRPALAVVWLVAGLTLAATLAGSRRSAAVALVTAGVVLGGLALLAAGGDPGGPVRTVAQARVSLASPDRSGALRAALGVVADHPLTGAGPGHANLRWEEPDGGIRFYRYVHNEYVQLAAELGLVGLLLLVALLVALALLLWGARAASPAGRRTWAGCRIDICGTETDTETVTIER